MKLHFIITLSLCSFYSLSAMDGRLSDAKKARTDNYEFQTAQQLLDKAKAHMHDGAKQQAIEAFSQALYCSESWIEKYNAHFGLAAVHGLECPDDMPNWSAAQNHYQAILCLPEILKPEHKTRMNIVRLNILLMALKTQNYLIALDYGKKLLDEQDLSAQTKDQICVTLQAAISTVQENYGDTQIAFFLENGIACLEHSTEGSNTTIKEVKLCGTPRVSKVYGLLLKAQAGVLFKNKDFENAQSKYQTALRCDLSQTTKADIWVQLGLLHKRKINIDMAKMFLEMAAKEEMAAINQRAYMVARMLLTHLNKTK